MGRKQSFKAKSKEKLNVKTSKGNYKWTKGNASLANPASSKYRDGARNKYNKNVAIEQDQGRSADMLKLHNVITAEDLANEGFNTSSVIDDPLANVFSSMRMQEDDMQSFKSNISGITDCTNNTFVKIQQAFEKGNSKHKHAFALFSAITDKIRADGGDENNNTAYYSLLINQLKDYSDKIVNVETAENDDLQLLAGVVYLVNMTVQHVPEPVLQQNSEVAVNAMVKVIKILDACPGLGNSTTVRGLNSLAIMVRPSKTLHKNALDLLLEFSFRSSPKIRQAGANGLWQAVSCAKSLTESESHPFSKIAVQTCVNFMKSRGVTKDSLPAFAVLKAVFRRLDADDMKLVFEIIVSFITNTSADTKLKSHCLAQTYLIFKLRPKNIPSELHGLFLCALTNDKNLPNIDDKEMITRWLALTVECFTSLYFANKEAALSHSSTVIKGCMSAMVSNNPQISKFGAETIRYNLLQNCLIGSPPDDCQVLLPIFRLIMESLSYKFSHIWNQSLNILGKFFQLIQVLEKSQGEKLWTVVQVTLPRLEAFKKNPDFLFQKDLENCFDKCIASVGPQNFLKAFPLNISPNQDFSKPDALDRSWILPALKRAMFKHVELPFFFEYFKPLSISFWKRASTEKNETTKSVLATLFTQMWDLLPVFAKFSEVNEVLFPKKYAGDLFNMLEKSELTNQWKPVCLCLARLVKTNPEYMKFFASRYIKKLLNNFILLDTDNLTTVNRSDLEKSILDCIEELNLLLTDSEKVTNFEQALQISQSSDNQAQVRLCDIIIRLSGALPLVNKQDTYNKLISVWMQSEDVDVSIRKKAYRALEEMCKSDKTFVEQNEETIIQELGGNLANCSTGAKKPRMKVINVLLAQTKCIDKYFAFLPELVLSFSETNKTVRDDAKLAVKSIAENENINRVELLERVMLGFDGDVTLMAKTLQVLTDLVGHWRKDLDQKIINIIFNKAIILMGANAKEILKSCVHNIHLMLNVLPKDAYICHVKPILETIAEWKETTTGNLRFELKAYIKKLCKVFGVAPILEICPPESNVLRMVNNVKKTERTNANKEGKNGGGEDGMEDDDEIIGKGRENMNDILADSDSDGDGENEMREKAFKKNKRGYREDQTVIRENEDDVLVFNSEGAAQSVLTKRPTAKITRKTFESNENVREQEDGRLVVSLPAGEKQDDNQPMVNEDENDDDIDELAGFLSDDDRDFAKPEAGYKAGGGGIHRNLSNGKGGKMGRKPKQMHNADKFRGKGKNKHDISAKGEQPYAYIKLNSAVANKRTKKKLRNEFIKQVGGIHRGTNKGGKAKQAQ